MAERSKRINVTFDEETDKMIAFWAKKKGLNKCEMIRKFVNQGIEDQEDIYFVEQALQDEKESGGIYYTTEELNKELGIE